MVAEEHELYRKHGGLSAEDHRRMEHLKVELDRCWDLLRQRQALRDAGYNPNDASERDENTVEGYRQ
jgi:hypothetical protein